MVYHPKMVWLFLDLIICLNKLYRSRMNLTGYHARNDSNN